MTLAAMQPRWRAAPWVLVLALALAQSAGVAPVWEPSADEATFTYVRDGVSHRVWYMTARAILARIAIARHYGLAAGVWRLGEEDQSLWSMS